MNLLYLLAWKCQYFSIFFRGDSSGVMHPIYVWLSATDENFQKQRLGVMKWNRVGKEMLGIGLSLIIFAPFSQCLLLLEICYCSFRCFPDAYHMYDIWNNIPYRLEF